MNIIADFHIHSKYSHATSKYMDLVSLATWGQLKGIDVMGTGDFTHPLWQKELLKQLQESKAGLFQIKDSYQSAVLQDVYDTCKKDQYFILSAEVSTIFKRNGRCYRTHTILLAPSFKVVENISKKLAKIGNIASDGRPILGLDVKDLAKIVFDESEDCMVIPAHIWTPWYGLLGSKSGFDSVTECFEEMTGYIYAVETGLSSSYAMNARISELDKFALLSNSDAHSVQKLGREANFIDIEELSYSAIIEKIKQDSYSDQLITGIEFFPERGKYYADGHRKCNICLYPDETIKSKGLCPVCGKKITVGVLHRVNQLADRSVEQAKKYTRQTLRVVPLIDIICDHIGMAETSKKVQALYHNLLQKVGNEFFILLHAPIEKIAQASNQELAQSINRLRLGDIAIEPGYDGEYGKILF